MYENKMGTNYNNYPSERVKNYFKHKNKVIIYLFIAIKVLLYNEAF